MIPNLSALCLALKVLQGRVFSLGKILLLPIVNTLLMVAVIQLLKSYWSGNIMLILNVLMGLIVYLSAAELFKLFLNYDIWYVLRVVRKGLSSERI